MWQNWKGHVRWTGPQIHKQLPDINVIAASMGTSGTMTGLGTYFKGAKPDVYRIAYVPKHLYEFYRHILTLLSVCTNAGDRVPGPREFSLMEEVQFPYKTSIDAMEEVGSTDSYSLSLDLTRQGIVCGPSSGFTLKGLLQGLEKRKQQGTLSELAGPTGEIKCVFMCCDLPYQYLNEYFDKLGPEKFKPLHNEVSVSGLFHLVCMLIYHLQRLRNVDLYRYDDAWELEAMKAINAFYKIQQLPSQESAQSVVAGGPSGIDKILQAKSDTQILDFRRSSDFDAFHLPNSVNIPLDALNEGAAAGSPFARPIDDCTMLEAVWRELESLFNVKDINGNRNASAEALMAVFRGKRVLTLCYDGDTARVANSVLRAKGVQSDSVYGGYGALAKVRLPTSDAPLLSTPIVPLETVEV